VSDLRHSNHARYLHVIILYLLSLARARARSLSHYHSIDYDTDASTRHSFSVSSPNIPLPPYLTPRSNSPQVLEASLSFLLAHSNSQLEEGCSGGEGAGGLVCGSNSRREIESGVLRAPSKMSGLGARASGLARPGEKFLACQSNWLVRLMCLGARSFVQVVHSVCCLDNAVAEVAFVSTSLLMPGCAYRHKSRNARRSDGR
jgi:hypothetical protein